MVYDFDTLRTSAQRAALGALSDLVSQVWEAFGAGAIDEAQAATLQGVIDERRAGAKPAAVSLGAALGARPSIFNPRRYQVSPDRSASKERRRRLCASGAMPPAIAGKFTGGECAVLSAVAHEVSARGSCELCVDAIAANAGVCRRLVQAALRIAESLGFIAITERPQRGRKSLTNVVRIVSREWLAWLARGPRRIGCKTLHPTNTRVIGKGRLSPSEAVKKAADGVRREPRREKSALRR